mmetsp:Transcript_94581/g.174073  ORF Transcript_94581/g.174073 Transcript_94581/m.174073 type:complete len:211 (-) Transcript_94581:27-659(-)
MANATQNMFGVPDGPGPKVQYWMWLVALFFAILLAVLFTAISHVSMKGEDGKAYGKVVLSMLKGTPMYSSGWILNDVVQDRYTGHYLWGTCLWITIGVIVLIQVEHFVHAPSGKLATGSCWAETEADAYLFGNQMVSLLQQTFAFVSGQLAQFALEDWFTVNDVEWFLLGFVFQVAGIIVEGARHWYLPMLFKHLEQDSKYLLKTVSGGL